VRAQPSVFSLSTTFSGSSRTMSEGSWVAQMTSPSPAMILAISSGGIGPTPLTWTAPYPMERTFRAVAARSGAVRQNSRTV
jgi:hypothetical protein